MMVKFHSTASIWVLAFIILPRCHDLQGDLNRTEIFNIRVFSLYIKASTLQFSLFSFCYELNTAEDSCSFSMLCTSVVYWFTHGCMKAVSLNDKTDVVKPQESPSTQAHVTEIPPTTPPPPVHQHQDKSSLNEVNKAAAYRNPEVDRTSYLVSQWQIRSATFREKWKTMDQLILVLCSLKTKRTAMCSHHMFLHKINHLHG